MPDMWETIQYGRDRNKPINTQIHPRNEVDNMTKGTVIKPYWVLKLEKQFILQNQI